MNDNEKDNNEVRIRPQYHFRQTAAGLDAWDVARLVKLSKDLRLVIHLKRLANQDLQQLDRLKGIYRTHSILDIDVPEVTLPVVAGRNLAVLVEAAVRDHILLHKGYNASEAFIKRQQELIQQNTPPEATP